MVNTQSVKIDHFSEQEMKRQKQGKIQRSHFRKCPQLRLTGVAEYCRASEGKEAELVSRPLFTKNEISNY